MRRFWQFCRRLVCRRLGLAHRVAMDVRGNEYYEQTLPGTNLLSRRWVRFHPQNALKYCPSDDLPLHWRFWLYHQVKFAPLDYD
jgi:NADH:ubiquinone oxidoreductase subunit